MYCGGAETPWAGAAGGGNVWRARRAGRCDQAWPPSDPAAREADALDPGGSAHGRRGASAPGFCPPRGGPLAVALGSSAGPF